MNLVGVNSKGVGQLGLWRDFSNFKVGGMDDGEVLGWEQTGFGGLVGLEITGKIGWL